MTLRAFFVVLSARTCIESVVLSAATPAVYTARMLTKKQDEQLLRLEAAHHAEQDAARREELWRVIEGLLVRMREAVCAKPEEVCRMHASVHASLENGRKM